MHKCWAGFCELCLGWYVVKDLYLLWQIAPGTFRGICYGCQDDLELKAEGLDWEITDGE